MEKEIKIKWFINGFKMKFDMRENQLWKEETIKNKIINHSQHCKCKWVRNDVLNTETLLVSTNYIILEYFVCIQVRNYINW